MSLPYDCVARRKHVRVSLDSNDVSVIAARIGQGQRGPARDIAERMSRKVEGVAPIRNALIAKGMIYSPAHGDTAFTVPLFDGFMKRTIPTFEKPKRQG
jgi:hypothetical protein